MAVANVKWFDANVYMGNKLAKMPAGTTMDSLVAQMEKAGYSGPEGYFRHFLDWGHTEDVSPSAGFDAQQYYTFKAAHDYYRGDVSKVTAADVNKIKTAINAAGMDAWTHYQKFGSSEMVNASNSFDTAAYLQAKSDAMGGALTAEGVALAIQKAGMNAYEHYMQFKGGAGEVAFDQTFVVASSKQISTDFTLTSGVDVATANVFNAARGWTPGGTDQVNTLDDDDVLTGSGTNPTLNFDFVRDADIGAGANTTITPTLNGVETVNVRFAGSNGAYVLDLQDAQGVQNINLNRVADGLTATVRNIAEAGANNLSVSNSQSPANTISFTYLDGALRGTSDEVNLALNNVNTANTLTVQGNLGTQGFETMALESTGGGNQVASITARDMQTVTISGDADLTLQANTNTVSAGIVEAKTMAAGFANVTGTLSKVDASALKGNITIALGNETVATKAGTSGKQVDFTYVGAEGNDEVTLANGMNAGDSLDLGLGKNILNVLATTQTGTVKNAQTLNVLGQAAGGNTIGVDTGVFTGLETVVIRNEGQALNTSTAQNLTTNILNLAATPAADVTVKHGTTNNSNIGNNIVQLDGAAGVTAMTVKIADAINTEARFNFQLYTDSDLTLAANGAVATGWNNANGANAVTTLNLADNDTESNTVGLTAQGYTAAGALRADTGTSYTTVTLTGGQAGQFLNLDRTANAFGVNVTGVNGNATSALAATQRDTVFATTYANTTVSVDAAGANLGLVLNGAGIGAADRLIATKVDAGAYVGDVVVRVGQADQAITTGTGNDTIIFDAINDTRAGLTIADTVKGGTGIDTIVIDGGSTVGATNIVLGASEWTNLTGIDVLRLGTNDGGGNYQLTVTDALIAQTDNGGRITIINNDGDLSAPTASAAVIDARQANGLSASKFITFYGENGDVTNGAVAAPNNRIILSDATANGGHILNGGDRDLQAHAVAANWNASGNRGNGNTIEYRNTSVVTEGDQVGISNFANIAFNNDQAVAQTLTLEVTTTVADRLADASHTAAATAQETLTIVANDGGVVAPLAGAALNVSAQATSNAFIFNVTTDNNATNNNRDVADVIRLNDNVGATTGHTVNMIDGGAVADTLSFYGATGDIWSAATTTITVAGTTNNGTVTIQNASGLSTSVHSLQWDNADTINLTNDNGATFTTLQAATTNLTFNGGNTADTIIGTAGANTINAGAGNDSITANAGNDTINAGAGADNITGGAGADTFGSANNFGATGESVASTANTFTAAGIVAGETVTFGNGVDYIADFSAAQGDKLDVVTAATAPTSLIGWATGALANGTTYVAYGTWNAATGVFTTAAGYNAVTAQDAIVVTGNGVQTEITTTGVVVLDNLTAALVAADFI